MSRARTTRTRSLVLAALLSLGAIGFAVPGVDAAVTYSRSTNFVLQEVPTGDLLNNTNGICHTGANLVIKNAQVTFNRTYYAQVASSCGLKVIWAFPDTVNYGTGTIYPTRVAALVRQVRSLDDVNYAHAHASSTRVKHACISSYERKGRSTTAASARACRSRDPADGDARL